MDFRRPNRARHMLALFLCVVLALAALRGEALAKDDASDFLEAPIEQLLDPSRTPSFFLLSLAAPLPEEDVATPLALDNSDLLSIEAIILIPGHGASDLSPPVA